MHKFGAILFLVVVMSCGQTSIVDREIILPEPRVLVQDELNNYDPSWHPSGKTIIYVAQSNTTFSLNEIDVHSGQQQELLRETIELRSPQYHTDGRRILFTKKGSAAFDLWIFDIQTRQSAPLNYALGIEKSLRISPDGRRVAFQQDTRLTLLTLENGAMEHVNQISFPIHSFCWVGSQNDLIFSAGQPGQLTFFLFKWSGQVLNSLGKAPIKGVHPDYFDHNDSSPLREIGPLLLYENQGAIYSYSFYPSQVTKIISRGHSPRWSPDGTRILYVNDRKIILESVFVVIHD